MFEEYFSDHDKEYLSVRKKEILQRPGLVSNRAFYVKRGLLRSYLIDDHGKIHIYQFAPESWILSDIESIMFDQATHFFIDAIEDSAVVLVKNITKDTFTSNNEKSMEVLEKMFRRNAVLQKRVIMLMSASAKQRYEYFLESYPQLANRIPLKMIASYLGITPGALSNIRNTFHIQN